MLRLVDNVLPLPVGNLRNAAIAARGFADAVEQGRIDLAKALIITVEQDGSVDYASLGDHPTVVEALGLLELAKVKIIAALNANLDGE